MVVLSRYYLLCPNISVAVDDVIAQDMRSPEAITGQSLEDYFQEHMCQPLGLISTSFVSPPHLPESIASCTIAGDSTSEWTEVIYPISSKPEIHAGGGSLYSIAKELSLILAEVLNDRRRLFKSGDTVWLLFESWLKTAAQSALGVFLQYLWATSPTTVNAWENAEPTFGLGYLINVKDIVETGRRAGTGSWWGMSGTAAWVDPQSGIACALFSQAFPYPNAALTYAHHIVEKQVYECLSGGS
ncbi:hypothetical protein PILCRDRAFT_9539 [Piloderma croceum F 1598]|uniref:Beta-lactamase-related domain-containing protein n=1 Tax=Piloderma croceum (strain F 1598) TaxID=765440 RepID=A0A0C3FK88_PILCF|nr:hypothetical protein PILCRDRAFT_9539 [Piloderma croceum F 1598]